MAQTEYEPRAFRLGYHYPCVVVLADGEECSATIMNISAKGFRLRVTKALTAGERLALRNDVGDVPVSIRWTLGNDAGGMFVRPECRS